MSNDIIKLVDEKIEELYKSIMDKPFRILGIFNDFFGEDKVDMQGYKSLNEFRSWLKEEPLYRYADSGDIPGISYEDYAVYSTESIANMTESQIEKVANALTSNAIKKNICDSQFIDTMFILVHFPHVRVTNEHDRFVDINHLWAKIHITADGMLADIFTLNRSEYPMLHLLNGYMHSHVHSIPLNNFTVFQHPCTGTGPINYTMDSLFVNYNEDMWNMFCLELSKYVATESIAGRPYKYLENIGTGSMRLIPSRFTTYLQMNHSSYRSTINKFVKHFINLKKLKFNYVNNSYSIGMSFIEYIVLISNEFIKWYNDQFNKGEINIEFTELKRNYFLIECIIDNGNIYDTKLINMECPLRYIGKEVCTFKGKKVTVNITDINKISVENRGILLNIQIALYILTTILRVLNYRYGRSKATIKNNQLGTEVVYL